MKSNKIPVYVLDDEPLILQGIISLLELMGGEDFEVVGSHISSELGLKEINKLQPQLLFLDIDMPGLNGFELLEAIDYEKYNVVFVTAYNEYAVKAFDVNAIDYLLKPLEPERFIQTLERIKLHVDTPKDVKDVLKEIKNKEQERIGIYTNSGYLLLDYDTIMYVKADNSYSQFFLADGKKLVHTKNLKHAASILPEERFIRISRSVLIQLEYMKEFSLSNGSITMKDNSEHSIGFTYKKKISSLLKERYVAG